MTIKRGFENFDDRMQYYRQVLENLNQIQILDKCETGIYQAKYNNKQWVIKFDIFNDNATGLEYETMKQLEKKGISFIQKSKLVTINNHFNNQPLEAIMKEWVLGEDIYTGKDLRKVMSDEEYMKAKAQIENQTIKLHEAKFANLDIKETNILKTPNNNFTLFDHNSYIKHNPNKTEEFYLFMLIDMLDIKDRLYTINEPSLKEYIQELRLKNPQYNKTIEEMANEVENMSHYQIVNLKNEASVKEARKYIYRTEQLQII